eukprot:scaffold64073_cov76-Cyclotella_meneghiniana.AAC.8
MANHRRNNVCNLCLEDTLPDVSLKDCSRCHGDAKYCSVKCQSQDWPIHKIFCGVKPPPPPSTTDESTVQALLLPQDSKVPVFVRVQVDASIPGGVNAPQYIPGTLDSHIRCYSSEQLPQYEDNDIRCGFSFFCGNQTTSLSENKCIMRILSGHAKALYGSGPVIGILGSDFLKTMLDKLMKWKGPLLIVKSDRYRKIGSAVPTYQDFDVGDVPHLVIFLAFKQ